MNSIITYEIVREESTEETNNAYFGSFIPGETVYMHIRIWNNKFGQEDVDNLSNAIMKISFNDFENKAYFDILKVSVQNDAYITPDRIDDIAIIKLGTIYGHKNIGSLSDIENYKEVKIKIGPLYENSIEGLKNLSISVVSQ